MFIIILLLIFVSGILSESDPLLSVSLRKPPAYYSNYMRLEIAFHSVYTASTIHAQIGIAHWTYKRSTDGLLHIQSTPLSYSRVSHSSKFRRVLVLDVPFKYADLRKKWDQDAFTQGIQVSVKIEAIYGDNLLYHAHLATPLLMSLKKLSWWKRIRIRNAVKTKVIYAKDEISEFYSDLPAVIHHYWPVQETTLKRYAPGVGGDDVPAVAPVKNLVILTSGKPKKGKRSSRKSNGAPKSGYRLDRVGGGIPEDPVAEEEAVEADSKIPRNKIVRVSKPLGVSGGDVFRESSRSLGLSEKGNALPRSQSQSSASATQLDEPNEAEGEEVVSEQVPITVEGPISHRLSSGDLSEEVESGTMSRITSVEELANLQASRVNTARVASEQEGSLMVGDVVSGAVVVGSPVAPVSERTELLEEQPEESTEVTESDGIRRRRGFEPNAFDTMNPPFMQRINRYSPHGHGSALFTPPGTQLMPTRE